MAAMTHKESVARAIAAQLKANGFIAYLAGGCVRDKLLGREPQDFDIATDALATTVEQLFPRTVAVGAQFGVMLVLQDGEAVEVATFRSDAEYIDGRRPVSVRFSRPEEDAQRRDFTINGMFIDPSDDRLLDYVGGQQDLRARVIRAIGDPRARIYEDRLRMLRAVRFAARLQFTIDPATFEALREAAPSITDMAWERIGDEIVRMLTDSAHGSARGAFELMDATGLLSAILPEVVAMKGVMQSPDYHPEGDVFVHTLGLLEQLTAPSETLALGALLHDVGKPLCAGRNGDRLTFYGHCEKGGEIATAICQRLRRSRDTWERVDFLVRQHLRHVDAPRMRLSTLKRFLAQEGIDELLELARMDSMASSKDLTTYRYCVAKREELSHEPILPPPLIRGHDLIRLGYAPGPKFADILHAVSDAQLEGAIKTRDEALRFVRDHFDGRD